MSEDVRNLAVNSLRQIAPDINIDDVDSALDLREAFDIDSMDFLNLVSRLSKELDIDIPEKDYPDMIDSLDALVNSFFWYQAQSLR